MIRFWCNIQGGYLRRDRKYLEIDGHFTMYEYPVLIYSGAKSISLACWPLHVFKGMNGERIFLYIIPTQDT